MTNQNIPFSKFPDLHKLKRTTLVYQRSHLTEVLQAVERKFLFVKSPISMYLLISAAT